MNISNMEVYFNLKIEKTTEFLKNFISLASSYMFTPLKESIQNIGSIQLAVMYDRNNYQKILALQLTNKDNRYKPERIFSLLQYLSVNPMAFYVATTSRIVKIIKEAWVPSYLAWAHRSAKKMIPIVRYCDLPREYDVKGDMDVVAMTLAALTSGVHRNAMSLRQVATQWIAVKLAYKRADKKLLSKMLTSLLVDTLIWMPSVLKYKGGVYGAEFVHSVAGIPIIELTKLRGCKLCRLKEEIEELGKKMEKQRCESYSRAVEFISDQIKTILGKYTRNYDPLMGGLIRLKSKLREHKLKGKKYKKITILLTEQSGPAQIVYILENMKNIVVNKPNLTLFYTQQTLWNRLLINDMKEQIEKLLKNNNIQSIDIKAIPIATTSPLLIKKIVTTHNFKDTLTIIQGPLIPSILLALNSEKIILC